MTSEKAPELLPCPFCGNTDIKWGGDDKIVGCWCENCQMTGPNHYGRFEWNTRSDLVAAKDARIAELEKTLRNVIGMLDDPTGGEHIRDMRGAEAIARAALAEKDQERTR